MRGGRQAASELNREGGCCETGQDEQGDPWRVTFLGTFFPTFFKLKNTQVTPGELPQEDNSPVTQILEAIPPELYVTNHKKWLSLRVGGGGGGGGMGLPFCC